MRHDQEESMDRMLLEPFSPVVVATYTDSSHWRMECESENMGNNRRKMQNPFLMSCIKPRDLPLHREII